MGELPSNDELRINALAAFQQVLVSELRPSLQRAFNDLKATPTFPRLLDEMLSREPAAKTTLVHWMHLPQQHPPWLTPCLSKVAKILGLQA